MLLSQGRPELAEKELRQALVSQPNDSNCHALLAICLLERKQYTDATDEAAQAIHLAPDNSFSHYVMAEVMYHRNRYEESRQAVDVAIGLDPYDPDYFALAAAIDLEQKNWKAALKSAKQGLEVQPDHVRCINLRAMALTKLGRTDEAKHSIDVALLNAPEDSYTHANQGWTLLNQSKPTDAMNHFKEALRLDPNSEFARAGIVEAMKARNIIYRWLLQGFLLLSRYSGRVQLLIILGLLFGQRALVMLTDSFPILQPLTPFIIIAYIGLIWLSWCGTMLFNLVLRFDNFDRLVLSAKERMQSNIVAVYLLVAIGWLTAGILTGDVYLMMMTAPFLIAMIPLNGAFAAQNTTLFWIMTSATVVATLLAIQAGIPSIATEDAFLNSLRISGYSTWASLLFIGANNAKKI